MSEATLRRARVSRAKLNASTSDRLYRLSKVVDDPADQEEAERKEPDRSRQRLAVIETVGAHEAEIHKT